MYLVFYQIKERKDIFKQIRLFEQAQYRNENDTHNPIKIIDITDNQINGRWRLKSVSTLFQKS